MAADVPEPANDLDEMVRDLLADPDYAQRRRHPRKTQPDEVIPILEDLYAAHDQAARHLPVLAEKMGHSIACFKGCSDCCNELVGVTHGEAHTIARWLLEPAQDALRARFLPRARAWVETAGASATRALDHLEVGNQETYLRMRKEHALLRLMCPVNEDGACTFYPVRPLICRLPYIVDTSEHCAPRPEGGAQARQISFPAYEQFGDRARQLLSGLQGALGHEPRERLPLARAILEALDALTPAEVVVEGDEA